MILGYMWLKCHNPEIDWETGTVKMTQCPKMCQCFRKLTTRFLTQLEAEEQENAWHAYYLRVATEILPLKTEKTTEELVPKEYHKFLKVFSKGESKHMPLISKTPSKQRRVASSPYLRQNRKKSPPLLMTSYEKAISDLPNQNKHPQSSVFLVPKKDGEKWMIQDYHYLNEHIVKNNYLLPLISQLVNKLKGAKLFTKMDLRWEYNNVHIKEEDKWKAAFVCFRGVYEPLVMYFRLCNSPATFQTMMNEIFMDMEDVVVVYIDDDIYKDR